jgi:hypothetical protein
MTALATQARKWCDLFFFWGIVTVPHQPHLHYRPTTPAQSR